MLVRSVHVYVLNYNGEELLPECLPSIQKAVENSPVNAQLFVIDNESTDRSLEVLRCHFPNVPVLRSKNRFLCSFNEFVFKDHSDIVILMNNDIKVTKKFIQPLIQKFEENENAFVVSSLCWDFSEQVYEGGLSVLQKKLGWWGTQSVDPRKSGPFLYTASVGACIAFRRDRFTNLGGFDDLYLPGTLEDLDICYRGWKKGWLAYFEPRSVIFHKGQATFRAKFGVSKIREMATRNTYFFTWKNITDKNLLLEHFLWIIPRFLYSLLRGDFAFITGTIRAFGGIKRVCESRRRDKTLEQISDQSILELFKPLIQHI